MVLVAWIEVFRPSGVRLEDEVDLDEIVTCLPVIQEVLQGIDDESHFARARDAMLAFPIVEAPIGLRVVEDAVDLYRRAQRAGLTIRSGVDCLVAACAIRHRLTVLHHDRDFARLARVSTLQARRIKTKR